MILRFLPDATLEQRAQVEAALRSMRVPALPAEGALLLRRVMPSAALVELAAMPGVAGLSPGGRAYSTLRVSALGWLSAACAVLGLLTLLAAQVPASLGSPADPLRMPETPHPAWPLLPIHGLLESAPSWFPSTVLPLLAVFLIALWPIMGRRLAERSPRTHTALGIATLALATWLAISGVTP